MKQLILILIIFPCFFSCSHDDNEKDYYVIKDLSNRINITNDSLPKVFPVFYGKHNFILINNSKIYYHHYDPYPGCGTGVDYNKPPRLNLILGNLTEIELKDLEKFLMTSINKGSITEKTIINISSTTDTIKNKALTILREYFAFNKEALLSIKRCTEEEEYVGFAKLKNIEYNASLIKWKIGFAQDIKPDEIIKFLPPDK